MGAVTFSDQEVEEFREVFELVDVDKGGTIEADEVHGVTYSCLESCLGPPRVFFLAV